MDKSRKVAFEAAREGGRILMSRLGDIKTIEYKAAFNIVTDVDKQSETAIIGILNREFPADEILAEESGLSKNSNSKRRWIIDPLDGTTNYTHTYPFFSVSIGLVEDGRIVLGVVYNPSTDEMFWAEPGKGAWLNDEPIHVSQVDDLGRSLLATGFPPDTLKATRTNMEQFKAITNLSHGVRRDGSAALDLCFVASGRLDGFWELKLAPWDLAAGTLIIEEAGGRVTDLKGGKLDLFDGHVLATNDKIHDQVMGILKQVEPKMESTTAKPI